MGTLPHAPYRNLAVPHSVGVKTTTAPCFQQLQRQYAMALHVADLSASTTVHSLVVCTDRQVARSAYHLIITMICGNDVFYSSLARGLGGAMVPPAFQQWTSKTVQMLLSMACFFWLVHRAISAIVMVFNIPVIHPTQLYRIL